MIHIRNIYKKCLRVKSSSLRARRHLNLHKASKRCPGRLLNVLMYVQVASCVQEVSFSILAMFLNVFLITQGKSQINMKPNLGNVFPVYANKKVKPIIVKKCKCGDRNLFVCK